MLIDVPIFVFLIAQRMSPAYHSPTLIVVLLIDSLWSIIAMMIGATKGRDRVDAWLGLLFGAMGALMAFTMRGDRKECAYCYSLVRAPATSKSQSGQRCQRASATI